MKNRELSNICSTQGKTKGLCMPCVVAVDLVICHEYSFKI